jgi:riboflavin kinase / FMN adenylyltransferase
VRVWRSLDDVPADLGRSVVVVGDFDDVHLGHSRVVRRAREVADADELFVVAVTLDPHLSAVLRPERPPLGLTDTDRLCHLLAEAGVDAVLAIPFSRKVAAWTPQEFVDHVIVHGLHAAVVVAGANLRFGARAAGDLALLTEAGRTQDFRVEGIERIALEGGHQVWSSTDARACFAGGDVEGASGALGHPYSVVGTVVRGEQRGRELGYPTANVLTRGLAAPTDGVYAGWLRLLDPENGQAPAGEPLPVAISVGTNPTFKGERERRVEAHVLDRADLDFYDRRVEISFVARIRGMMKFDGIDALLEAMAHDVVQTRQLLGLGQATSLP